MARIIRGRKINRSEAASAAGLSQATWRNYTAKLITPPPDGYAETCGCPWWYEGTIKTWRAARPTTPGRPRKPVAV